MIHLTVYFDTFEILRCLFESLQDWGRKLAGKFSVLMKNGKTNHQSFSQVAFIADSASSEVNFCEGGILKSLIVINQINFVIKSQSREENFPANSSSSFAGRQMELNFVPKMWQTISA